MTNFTAGAEKTPLVAGTRWVEVDLSEERGPGVAVWFPIAPTSTGGDPMALIERLIARPDPLLAPIVEHGVDGDQGYIVWSGTTDDTLASLSGPLTMSEIVTLADVLLAGFERLHAQGFVHPGITLELVRLALDPKARSLPELLGFGLPTGTRTTRDDLVSVGHLLYRLYTGRDAYEPGEPTDGSVAPPPFSSVRPGVVAPVAFESAVLQAIGPESRRFVTAGEMRGALIAHGRRTGIEARPAATTAPHMRRALTTGVVGLEGLLTPEAHADEQPSAVAPPTLAERRLGLVPALGLAAATLLVGFLVGRATSSSTEVATSEGARAATPALAASPAPSEAPAVALGGSASKSEPSQALPSAAVMAKPAEPEPAAAIDTAKPIEPSVAAKAEAPAAKPAAAAAGVTRIEVVSDPPGANVLVRGRKLIQKTPFTLEVTSEWLPIELVFDKRKHHPRRKFIESLTGPEMKVEVTLRPH